jgi:hypothetical protein
MGPHGGDESGIVGHAAVTYLGHNQDFPLSEQRRQIGEETKQSRRIKAGRFPARRRWSPDCRRERTLRDSGRPGSRRPASRHRARRAMRRQPAVAAARARRKAKDMHRMPPTTEPSAGISSTIRFSGSSPPSRNERRCGRTRVQRRAIAGARTLIFALGDLPRA